MGLGVAVLVKVLAAAGGDGEDVGGFAFVVDQEEDLPGDVDLDVPAALLVARQRRMPTVRALYSARESMPRGLAPETFWKATRACRDAPSQTPSTGPVQ